MADLDKLKDHLHTARLIIDERNLYSIWDYVPKGDDPDFRGNSFNEAVRQGVYFKTYDDWSDKLEDLFLENNLDYLKFKRVTTSGDARKTSKLPAALFVRRVKELERIFEYPSVFDSYKTSEKQPATWPHIVFENNTVKQGAREHKFTQPALSRLIAVLWENRRIETPAGNILEPGKPMDRDKVNKLAKIRNHERFTGIANGIRRAMKKKGIELLVLYPDKVILVLKQSRK